MNHPAVRDLQHHLADREFENIRELLEMLMSELSPSQHRLRMKPNFGWAPPTDVYETETDFVVTMDIAGMDSNNINVYTDGKMLTIRGIRSEVAPDGKKQFHKLEIQVGPFQRHIALPVPVDSQNMFTNYSNGLLEIRLKKKFDGGESRRVEVK